MMERLYHVMKNSKLFFMYLGIDMILSPILIIRSMKIILTYVRWCHLLAKISTFHLYKLHHGYPQFHIGFGRKCVYWMSCFICIFTLFHLAYTDDFVVDRSILGRSLRQIILTTVKTKQRLGLICSIYDGIIKTIILFSAGKVFYPFTLIINIYF